MRTISRWRGVAVVSVGLVLGGMALKDGVHTSVHFFVLAALVAALLIAGIALLLAPVQVAKARLPDGEWIDERFFAGLALVVASGAGMLMAFRGMSSVYKPWMLSGPILIPAGLGMMSAASARQFPRVAIAGALRVFGAGCVVCAVPCVMTIILAPAGAWLVWIGLSALAEANAL